jgi:hypothetical protein
MISDERTILIINIDHQDIFNVQINDIVVDKLKSIGIASELVSVPSLLNVGALVSMANESDTYSAYIVSHMHTNKSNMSDLLFTTAIQDINSIASSYNIALGYIITDDAKILKNQTSLFELATKGVEQAIKMMEFKNYFEDSKPLEQNLEGLYNFG